VIGVIVFFVGDSVIGSVFDASGAMSTIRRESGRVTKDPLFNAAARRDAQQLGTELDAQLAKARAEIQFKLRSEFDLATGGDPHVRYNNVTAQVAREVKTRVDRLNVMLGDKRLGLPPVSPTDRDEMQQVLTGLDLVATALDRLFNASEQARARRPQELALRSIENVKIEARGGGVSRSRRRSESEFLDEVRASIEFRASYATLLGFFEACRNGERPVLPDNVKITVGKDRGDPLIATMDLVALSVRQRETQ
jgi:hypothetical protein